MNITKEQMLEWFDSIPLPNSSRLTRRELREETLMMYKAIRSLIESSSPPPAPTDLTPTDAEMQEHFDRGEMNDPAPLPKEADVQKSIHLSKSVEEAMDRISEIMEDRIHSMQSHASVYGSDRESAQMRAEANSLSESLAVIRAALSNHLRCN